MRRCGILVAPVLVAMTLVPASARADEIQLKSGKRILGIIDRETKTSIRIITAAGRKLTFKRSDIEMFAESPETGDEEIDARLAEIDTDSADELMDVARWARKSGKRGWKLVAMLALRADDGHEEAHKALGHRKVGEKWYTSKKAWQRALEKDRKERMLRDGYVRWRRGWIKREDRRLADKNPKAFIKDDRGIWRKEADVRREQGYVLINGRWVKAGTEQDRRNMADFQKLTGDAIWAITTRHFRLFVQQYPPERVDEFGKLVEDVYTWFVKEMGKPADFDPFRGQQAHLWVLKDKDMFLTWLKHYKNTYGLSKDAVEFFSKSRGNCIAGMVGTTTPDQSHDIKNQLVHQAGHFLIRRFSPGVRDTGTAAWLVEAVANHAEHVHCGLGQVTCTTRSDYGGEGGLAKKKFSTKDAKIRADGLARRRDPEYAFETLDKLDLNSLNGDHLAKGWTIIEWLWTKHHDKLVRFLEALNTAKTDNALQRVFGWTMSQLDKEWEKHVRKGA